MLKFFSFLLICAMSTVLHAQYSWKSVQLHGGGYVPGITFHPSSGDGYIRTDVGGAYSLNTDGSWNPLNDTFTSGDDMGSVAIAIDESDADYLYSTGGLYPNGYQCVGSFFLSSNKGQTWTRNLLSTANVSGATGAVCLNGNADGRGTGNRIAAKGTTIYFATNKNGLLKSTNRGTSWAIQTVATVAKEEGFTAVYIDKNDAVYAAPNTGGLYRSTDGGTAWASVSGISGVVYQMAYSTSADVAFITTNTNNADKLNQGAASGGKLFKLTGTTATEITNLPSTKGTGGLVGLAISPDAQEIAVATSAIWNGGNPSNNWNSLDPHGYIYYSSNGGTNWKDILKTGSFDASSSPYVNASVPHWVSAVGIDPKKAGRVIFGTGFGMLSAEDVRIAQPAWKFASKGIEETVPLGLASTTSGAALVSVLGDVDGAYYVDLDSPPTDRHKVSGGATVGTIYDLDYAGQNPNFMVMVHKNPDHKFGAYSKDGGKTWTDFVSSPSGMDPDDWETAETHYIAVSADAKRIVWNINANNKGIYSSSDSGKTWQQVTGTNDLRGFRIVSDKVAPNTFYVYNSETGVLHKSVNGGTWNSANSTQLAKSTDGSWAYSRFRLFASPFNEGELWAIQGAQNPRVWLGGTNIGGVRRSTDGGTAFSKISGIEYAKYIGFGKGSTTGTQAVYFVGMAQSSDVSENVYRSTNNSIWAAITNNSQKYGEITMVIGDPCIYSRVYLGTSGRGIIYGEEASNANSCPNREDFSSSSSGGISSSSSAVSSPSSSSNSYSSSSTEHETPIIYLKNPYTGAVGVQTKGNAIILENLPQNAKVEVYNLSGKRIYSNNSGNPKILVQAKGIYIVKIDATTFRIPVMW